mmetsp:Transcript_40374/g.73047  ORF Transcript_40374/g.73047 Transcript_40374/m.73047 type:complete len:218 (-) Transcript_40374:133-786(-)
MCPGSEAEELAGDSSQDAQPAPSQPPPEPETGHKCTVFFFDWDDTLLPTSQLRLDKPIADKEFAMLDAKASELLEFCILHGRTMLVTNAKLEWVQQTAEEHLPSVAKILNRIEVVSARDTFESKIPNDPVAWKVEAFCNIKENSKIMANLIAVGDSWAEMVAIREVAKLYHLSYFKAVKLKEEPSCTELHKQLGLLKSRMAEIVQADRNLSITLTRK